MLCIGLELLASLYEYQPCVCMAEHDLNELNNRRYNYAHKFANFEALSHRKRVRILCISEQQRTSLLPGNIAIRQSTLRRHFECKVDNRAFYDLCKKEGVSDGAISNAETG